VSTFSGEAHSRSALHNRSQRRFFEFQRFSGLRTSISLITVSVYGSSKSRAVASVFNRYYDPTTDQFLSVDPAVAQTNQPYVFTNDNPLNATDPLGLCGGVLSCLWSATKTVGHAAKAVGNAAAVGALGLASLTGWGNSSGITTAFCVNASLGYGNGASATGCVGKTGNGTTFESWTVGSGGSSPNASLGVTLEFSNAQTPSQLQKVFSYSGISYGQDGGYAGVQVEVGTDSKGKKIWVYSMGVGITPLSGVSLQGGKSYTWTRVVK
jgi:hypothetical protein